MTRTITVLAGDGRVGRCRECRARIQWVTVPRDGRQPARVLPFDLPRPVALSEFRQETGVRYEVWPRTALHQCRSRQDAS